MPTDLPEEAPCDGIDRRFTEVPVTLTPTVTEMMQSGEANSRAKKIAEAAPIPNE